MAQHLAPRLRPGSRQAWTQVMQSLLWASLGWYPMASVCPLSSLPPHCRSPVWKLEETGPGYPLANVQLSQSTTTGSRDYRSLGLWAGTVLDSCTNLCTPLYICYIECIYVGNMLASVCCCCASCAPQHSSNLALAGVGAKVMPFPRATTTTTTTASPHLSVCVLSSVHASIGLMQLPLSLQLSVHMTVKW